MIFRLRSLGKDGDLLFALFAQGIDEGTELRDVVRAEDDVDEREFLFEELRLAFFLRHAAAHGDDELFFALFELF